MNSDNISTPRMTISINYQNTDYKYRVISNNTISYLIDIIRDRFDIDKDMYIIISHNDTILNDDVIINEISNDPGELTLYVSISENDSNNTLEYIEEVPEITEETFSMDFSKNLISSIVKTEQQKLHQE